ncbi:MAG TPA: hypothetical protein VJS65_17350 [Verrucomicrobiae bacterium]|nr:hypothetical protein [Verrucomicrobiae bacterium]
MLTVSCQSQCNRVWLAGIAFTAVELEKWIRFGGRRGEHTIPD